LETWFPNSFASQASIGYPRLVFHVIVRALMAE